MFLAKWLGVAQKTAWKMGHAIRELMDPGSESQPPLHGIVELNENTLVVNPALIKALNTNAANAPKNSLDFANPAICISHLSLCKM